ncbi:MAG: flagellar hook-basal body complex protein FliE [Desulfobacterales bacterium]|nr:flagellar hook-basal body complex protein FliE [Desulfobacterales bacterium]
MDGINGINRISVDTETIPERIGRKNPEFANRIKAAVEDVNSNQHRADDAIEKVIKGEMGIHEGMLTIGKASTSLKILAQTRNKVMAAYNEIRRMQI